MYIFCTRLEIRLMVLESRRVWRLQNKQFEEPYMQKNKPVIIIFLFICRHLSGWSIA